MSEVKVNKISPRSGTTVTLGDSGDTFTIPSGATINNQGTATNFGATGSASWTTTVKTSGFTAVAGEGYFVDTSSGAVSVNLPAGTAGAVVAFKDYLNSFDTHALTLVQNGSDKIGGSTVNAIINTEGIAVTLIFIDSTQGWLVTDDGLQSSARTDAFVTATGGTITTCGNFKVHTFTGPGTFCVSDAGNAAGSNTVDYLVVGAGGSGGAANGAFGAGAGGAGGFRVSNTTCMPTPQTSPLVAPNSPSPAAIPVSATGFPIVVGGGGASAPSLNANGNNGNLSSFSTISSAGGGFGAGGSTPSQTNGGPGGSGGGGWGCSATPGTGGTGNTPPVSPAQGNDGGISIGGSAGYGGAGGGGAATAGGNTGSPAVGGPAGAGSFVVSAGFAGCNGTPGPVSGARYFSGGGGGSSSTGQPGGDGGGGKGGDGGSDPGGAGTANTGGGGGGTRAGTSGAGGSGIVIIRYKFQ
jgi:hypothetical protein